MAGKTPAPRRRRRKKSGKYTPLIWILTGALIAFFISYTASNRGSGGFNKLLNRTNSTKLFDKHPIEKIASNFTKKNDTPPAQVKNDPPAVTGSSKVKIFMARQEEEGVRLVPLEISIASPDKPLSQTLEILLTYPTKGDLFNLIPYNSRILKIYVKDRIAHIHLSTEFEFNSYGRLGYQVQIYQIVYTAAQFSTIDAVYFYTGEKALKYLGGDGTIINNPVYPFSYLPTFN